MRMIERIQVLKPNYQFAKRQRELEKKKKKDEKTAAKVSSTEDCPVATPVESTEQK